MRILHIAAANMLTGGGERHVAALATEQAARGHEVGIIAPEGGDLERIAAESGIVYLPAPIAAGFGSVKVRAVRHAIQAFHPDIVHAHGHRAALFARVADTLAPQRLVVTVHGIHVEHGALSPVKMALEKSLQHRTAWTIATCQADAARAVELGIASADRITTVYNEVRDLGAPTPGALRAEIGAGPDVIIVLHVGRISPAKDHPTLLAAFEQACLLLCGEHADHPDNTLEMHLAMICPGSTAERNAMQRAAAAMSVGSRIHVLGPREDLASAYADADMFVLTSRWEARPYVLVEAMTYACPVISTDVGGVAEIVTDGETGLLAEPGDVQGIANSIVWLADDAELRERLGSAGQRAVAGRFTLQGMVDSIGEVYEQVLG